jgi:hypothetical protein
VFLSQNVLVGGGDGGEGPYLNHYGLAKMPTMSCQAIIRDKRNEELKAIFDCSKGILEHMGTTFGALLGVIVGRDSMGT